MTSATEAQAKEAAEAFRKKHGLGAQPLGDLIAIIEQTTGHDVAIIDTETDQHGLTMRDPLRGRVFIGVARTSHPMRQRSTLAHELGHILFQDQIEDLTLRSSEEIRADAFARHLLIPQHGLTALLGNGQNNTEAVLSDIVQRYLVSPAIAAIAMRDGGYIDAELASEWRKLSTRTLATKYGWRDHYENLRAESDQVRAPQGLLARAIRGYQQGVVSAQTVATLRAVPVETILTEFNEAGIFPKTHEQSEYELNDLSHLNTELDWPEGSAATS